jgi:hypothetical protein
VAHAAGHRAAAGGVVAKTGTRILGGSGQKKEEDERPAPEKLHAGDTIDFDVEDNGQAKLF